MAHTAAAYCRCMAELSSMIVEVCPFRLSAFLCDSKSKRCVSCRIDWQFSRNTSSRRLSSVERFLLTCRSWSAWPMSTGLLSPVKLQQVETLHRQCRALSPCRRFGRDWCIAGRTLNATVSRRDSPLPVLWESLSDVRCIASCLTLPLRR